MKKLFPISIIVLSLLIINQSCDFTEKAEEKKLETSQYLYKNHSDTAQYVGKEECKKCHQSIYDMYAKTEMGHSLSKASLKNSVANFHQQKSVYDEFKNLYYQPFSINEKLFIKEYRLDKSTNDTLYSRTEEIDYIIGSGQHTNSHLMQKNGYLHQIPLTFYAQKGEWHLPPGFEDGGNTSFDRSIEVECITCHNGFAKHVKGSLNKYSFIPEGIDCERCHGPGSIHVNEKESGVLVDVSKQIDYSIVNPKKLSPELQMDVCQRCHLQGISVLKEGKTFFDFKPGMYLNEVFDVFQSRFTDSLSSFLMASHPDRLRMSECFIESNKNENPSGLTCITCHNPHVSVRDVDDIYFNSKCIACHTEKKCSESEMKRGEDNCIECHMGKSATYDIPHVNITDHKISKFPIKRNVAKSDLTKSELEKQDDFIKLVCRTTINPDDKLNAKAYLNYFEKYAFNPDLLVTAEEYLKNYAHQNELFDLYVRLYFLKGNYSKVEQYTNNKSPNLISDEWTNYRIGQSLVNLNKHNKALPYLNQAVKIAPFHIDFSQKLAGAFTSIKQNRKALEILTKLVELYPKNASVQNDLGFSIVMNAMSGIGNIDDSEQYFLNALNLNPDLMKSYENLISLYVQKRDKPKAELYLKKYKTMNRKGTLNYNKLKKIVEAL